MAAYHPLRRELPSLNQDGSIKLAIVLRQARAWMNLAAERAAASRIRPTADRVARIRSALQPLRNDIEHDRAFWSILNVPAHRYEHRLVRAWGHAWIEAVYVGPIAPAASDAREAA